MSSSHLLEGGILCDQEALQTGLRVLGGGWEAGQIGQAAQEPEQGQEGPREKAREQEQDQDQDQELAQKHEPEQEPEQEQEQKPDPPHEQKLEWRRPPEPELEAILWAGAVAKSMSIT